MHHHRNDAMHILFGWRDCGHRGFLLQRTASQPQKALLSRLLDVGLVYVLQDTGRCFELQHNWIGFAERGRRKRPRAESLQRKVRVGTINVRLAPPPGGELSVESAMVQSSAELVWTHSWRLASERNHHADEQHAVHRLRFQ